MVTNDVAILDHSINEVTFNTLYKKHQRINLGLKAIQNNVSEFASFQKNKEILRIPVFEKPPPTSERPTYCKNNSKMLIFIN